MTPTQMARRSDALYADGTCGMTRRVLCDMVAQREADLEDARAECANLRELATYALKHIIEFECEEPDLKMFRGKPCEDCADAGSSDCPKCMPRMFDVLGIEVS